MGSDVLHKRIPFDSIWNLAGVLFPAVVGIALTPVILSKLGASRFGLLSQLWLLCGYAGMFDFGFGMVLTRSIAAFYADEADNAEAKLRVARRLIRLAWALVGALAVVLMAIWLFGIGLLPKWAADPEIRSCITLLIFLIPVSSITSVYRGVLVGKGHFARANAIRILLGVATFGAPLFVVGLTSQLGQTSVAEILATFLAFRVLLLLVIVKWGELPAISSSRAHPREVTVLMRRELGGSAVMLAMSFLMPFIASLDRAVLTPVVSLATVGGYNIILDTMMKVVIWPNAVAGVGLHRFSRLAQDPARDLALFIELQFQVFILVVPAIFILVQWGPALLIWWLRVPSSYLDPSVVHFLAAGAFFLAFAQVPSVLFYARKAESVPLFLNLLALPIYFVLLRWGLHAHGLVGLTWVVCGRMALDCVAFHLLVSLRGVRWFRSARYVTTTAALIASLVLLLTLKQIGR